MNAGEKAPARFWLTRFVLLRLLGFVYAVAFLVAINQILPLAGSHGLLPVGLYLDRARHYLGSGWAGFERLPSLFWLGHSDGALLTAAWAGFALSCLVLAGWANSLMLAALWLLYMSFVHVGQEWYAYGWETQLLETGFLAIFFCPLLDARPFPRREPPRVVIVLFAWLICRVMLGSGLIKLRGDPVWRDLTALYYQFETQPLPNPLSRWFHFLPHAILHAGVIFNYAAELAAPLFVFGPRRARHIAGAVIVAFQLVLIASGNLSFLNWLTIVPALACFDDGWWSRLLPGFLVRRAEAAAAAAEPSMGQLLSSWTLAVVVAALSIAPVRNLLSPRQMMNTSFTSLDLVNTYGAFGSVDKERLNPVIEGTDAADPGMGAAWKEYPYKGLPVDLFRRPPQVAPYQLRLDWQIWIALATGGQPPSWAIHLLWKLLHNDPGALSLLAGNPFPDRPPRFIRIVLYRYEFAPPGSPGGRWWNRHPEDFWIRPLSVDSEALRRYVQAMGWRD